MNELNIKGIEQAGSRIYTCRMEKNKKRIYGVRINARLMNDMFSQIGVLKRAAKHERVSKDFEKRLMLAVTQVNGCEMCSYYHTAEALKQGMSRDEVNSLLAGEFDAVPEYELPALLYAQHYAQTIGRPQGEVKDAFLKNYDRETAQDIAVFIKAIMLGNAQGNIAGAFKNRLKGKPEAGSSLFREISVLLSDIVLMPALLIKAIAMMPFKKKV